MLFYYLKIVHHTFNLQNNDEKELRERQKQRAAELQQQNLASPATPADRRKSMGPATGMTNAALVEHYSNCIKLSAENVRTCHSF